MTACKKSSMLLLVVACLAISVTGDKSPFEIAYQQAQGQIKQLNAPCNQLNILSGPLLLVGQGPWPTIITGFTNIVSTLTAGMSQGTALENLQKNDIDQFTTLTQALLNCLIGKSNLLSHAPFVAQPVTAALKTLEATVDATFFTIMNSQNQELSGHANETHDSLNQTFESAISAFDNLLQ